MMPEQGNAGTVTLPIRITCGSTLILSGDLQVPVAAVVKQDDEQRINVQISADHEGLRTALSRFFRAAERQVASTEFTSPVDCHSSFPTPQPSLLTDLVDQVVGKGAQ